MWLSYTYIPSLSTLYHPPLLLFIAMLEYAKTILLKVSFDKILFEKELRKALRMLVPEEMNQLKTWCYEQFAGIYQRILNRVFAQAA